MMWLWEKWIQLLLERLGEDIGITQTLQFVRINFCIDRWRC